MSTSLAADFDWARSGSAYDIILTLAAQDMESISDLLSSLADGVDVDELRDRFHREHVVNLSGRFEARVYLDESPDDPQSPWLVTPICGDLAKTGRSFESEYTAKLWVSAGGLYSASRKRADAAVAHHRALQRRCVTSLALRDAKDVLS